MEINHLNSLRLGFSTFEADKIKIKGINVYINEQLEANNPISEPDFLKKSPRSLKELQELKNTVEKGGDDFEKAAKTLAKLGFDWKAFVLKRSYETPFPLREKINLFFQNHFVVSLQSVKVPFWIFKHFECINNHSLGNYKTLIKEIISTNAMVKYLDNQKNTRGKNNENLARELLELFTLGEGNYSESDIKNTALALAGLSFGEEKAEYRRFFKDNSEKTIFGKTANFDLDEVVNLILEQKNTAYFLSEKVLKFFFYDNPSPEKIKKYGDFLKQNQFDLKMFFSEIFNKECLNPMGGNQIKNPLTYVFQIYKDLNLVPNYKLLAFFLKNQSMDIYDQANVKGWKGGQNWLSSQIYADRNQMIDFIILGNYKYGQILKRKLAKFDLGEFEFKPKLKLKNTDNAKQIINELCERMIFKTNPEMETEMDQVLKYDFDPKSPNAQQHIHKLYLFLAKTPEFQII